MQGNDDPGADITIPHIAWPTEPFIAFHISIIWGQNDFAFAIIIGPITGQATPSGFALIGNCTIRNILFLTGIIVANIARIAEPFIAINIGVLRQDDPVASCLPIIEKPG